MRLVGLLVRRFVVEGSGVCVDELDDVCSSTRRRATAAPADDTLVLTLIIKFFLK